MSNLSKILTLFLSLIFLPNLVWSNDNHSEKLGLNLDNPSDFAIYMMLYQIGLKDRSQNIFGDDSCIDLKKNSSGETILSFGIKTDAFETGTAKFTKENDQKYKKINGSLNELFNFFKNADYNPKVSVRSYADPQDNIMKKYDKGSAIGKKYETVLFGKDAYLDPKFNTESKRKNYRLAYDRGEAFIQNYFPDDMKKHVKTTPYHSPDLEVGNNQTNSDQYACPERRSIVVDMTFNPDFKIQTEPGSYTPGFKVAEGVSNHENILAAIFDAEGKKIEDLPPYCRNLSAQIFIQEAKKRHKNLKSVVEKRENINALQGISSKYLTEEMIEATCSRMHKTQSHYYKNEGINFYEECRKNQRNIRDSFLAFGREGNKENLYNLVASLTLTGDRVKHMSSQNFCPSSNRACQTYRNLIRDVGNYSKELSFSGKVKNSSHFMDCFSNELFYKKELKQNFEEYFTPVVDLRDPFSGEMKISYGEENMPKTAKGTGFLCQACGNGLKFEKGALNYHHRAKSSDHSAEDFKDSQETFTELHQNTNPETMFLMGHQKGLNVYVIKGCKTSSLEEIQQNAQMINVQDLKDKRVKVGPNDCVFKPKVINSCSHSPKGAGSGESGESSKSSQVLSLLTGKNLEIALKTNLSMIDEVLNGLKDDYINTCQITGKTLEKVQADPKIVIDNVLCRNRGIHIPRPSFEAKDDCPEVAKRVSAQ